MSEASSLKSSNSEDLVYIRSTRAIREQARRILALSNLGKTHFSVHPEKLSETAAFVAAVTRKNYPDLKIPFHSRWKHFDVGGVDRNAKLAKTLAGLSADERMRAQFDLVLVSVLLDAGAGTAWKYLETETGQSSARSEGLAVASLHMFLRGDFSSDPKDPYCVDAKGLQGLSRATLIRGFQVSDTNPLVGVDGRLSLLNSLGHLLGKNPLHFGSAARPSGLVDFLKQIHGARLKATDILTALQVSLGEIWPGRVTLNGVNLGDVWPYAPLGQGFEGLVPFHKLSQWLTYSVVGPIQDSGISVEGFEDLTGLPEYRNGGLLLDSEILKLRDPALKDQAHHPSSELVVEWRALTVALLEPLAAEVRTLLGKTETELQLGKVLEGGTWAAGREIAAKLRPPAGAPPINIESDGTVF